MSPFNTDNEGEGADILPAHDYEEDYAIPPPRPSTPWPSSRNAPRRVSGEDPNAVSIIRIYHHEEEGWYSYDVFRNGDMFDEMQVKHCRPIHYHLLYDRPEMGSWDFQFHSGPLHSDERNAHSDAPAIGSISKQGGRALESLKFRIKLRSEILHVRAVKPGEPFRVFIDGKLFEVRRSAPPLQRELEIWDISTGMKAAFWQRLSPPGILDGVLTIAEAYSPSEARLLLIVLGVEELHREQTGDSHSSES